MPTSTRASDPISGEPLKLKEADFLKLAKIIRFVDRVAFNRLQGAQRVLGEYWCINFTREDGSIGGRDVFFVSFLYLDSFFILIF